ncbi:MAG: hypothetical protein FJZ11_03600 [Candidatus Omnitrophica bacterium]|nr:hypothetical protein [Candidatus Omnitrophota bacterium]
MRKKGWQKYSLIFKKLLNLEYSPVAIRAFKGTLPQAGDKKLRICRAILEAGAGKILKIDKNNNACFGAAWHLGFHQVKDPEVTGMVKKFVVEGEKLFCSYQALDKLLTQMNSPPDNSRSYFILAPLDKIIFKPELVIFILNPEAASRLLTLVTFIDGIMPKIKIGGPTCSMILIYPQVAQEVNLSFYDSTARKICNIEKDKLLISIPFSKIPAIIKSINKCSAGKAKIEYPKEFREFLKQRLTS